MNSMINRYTQLIQNKNNAQISHSSQDELRTHVKAYKPKGQIIEPDTFCFSKDAESLNFFLKGIQGKGNDYSIGRINDIAIKLGGLGIATTIAVSKGTPIKKGMEFVGLASWLGAMSLWPKLAINKPIKYLKGVDLDLEYKTSRGHKKKFYNDPQFMCWDLISDEEINKMGDKLGVPRNIQNRRKAVENKARQVAIQGNTLSSLTAGLATPLVASLVADQLDKRVFSAAAPVINANKADALAKKLTANITNYQTDKETIDFINSKVTDNMSATVKDEIKSVFESKTDDICLKSEVRSTIDKIFSAGKTKSSDIAITKDLNTDLAKIFGDKKVFPDSSMEKLVKLGEKYSNKLTPKNIGQYVDDLEEFLLDNSRLDLEDIKEKVLPNVKKLLSKKKTVTLLSPKQIKNELTCMSKLIDVYNQKVYRDFENGFFKLIGSGENSVNAKLWSQMSKDIAKALNISDKNLAEIVKNMNAEAAGATIDKTKVLSSIFDSIISNPKKYNETMKKLGKIAENVASQNEKQFAFSLQYIDNMQAVFSKVNQSGSLSDFSQALKVLLSYQRQNILKNYIGTNETIFAPINVLNSLELAQKTISGNNGTYSSELYDAIKKIIVSGQSTDHFVNKLDMYSDFIRNERDFANVSNIIFADLSDAAKANLPEALAQKINANMRLKKQLMVNLSDGIKLDYLRPNSEEALSALRSMNLYKYADELFDIGFCDSDKVVKTIGNIAQKSDTKLQELKQIFKLTNADLARIKAGEYQPLYAACMGSWDKGSGFLESGRHKVKAILSYVGVDDLASLGDIHIIKSKTGKITKIVGQDLYSFVKTNAKETLNYNRWIKRVGLAFVGLCGVTAFAISQLGKKNEFNPDIYQERKSA